MLVVITIQITPKTQGNESINALTFQVTLKRRGPGAWQLEIDNSTHNHDLMHLSAYFTFKFAL